MVQNVFIEKLKTQLATLHKTHSYDNAFKRDINVYVWNRYIDRHRQILLYRNNLVDNKMYDIFMNNTWITMIIILNTSGYMFVQKDQTMQNLQNDLYGVNKQKAKLILAQLEHLNEIIGIISDKQTDYCKIQLIYKITERI